MAVSMTAWSFISAMRLAEPNAAGSDPRGNPIDAARNS
jgi:hypothetical protein